MAKINGAADVEIRIYRGQSAGNYVAFASNKNARYALRITSAGKADDQGLWLLLEAIRQEMESWIF
jgi:hypothetical protein